MILKFEEVIYPFFKFRRKSKFRGWFGELTWIFSRKTNHHENTPWYAATGWQATAAARTVFLLRLAASPGQLLGSPRPARERERDRGRERN
jgi:hypothetical protein